MNDKAKTEETNTVTKGSADSLHVHIPYNAVHIQRIRQLKGRRWSQIRNCGSFLLYCNHPGFNEPF